MHKWREPFATNPLRPPDFHAFTPEQASIQAIKTQPLKQNVGDETHPGRKGPEQWPATGVDYPADVPWRKFG